MLSSLHLVFQNSVFESRWQGCSISSTYAKIGGRRGDRFFVFLKTIVFLRKSATHTLEGEVAEGETLEIDCVLWWEEAAAWGGTGAAPGEPSSPELTGLRGIEGMKDESEAWAGGNSEDVRTRQVPHLDSWLLEGSSSLWPLCVWWKVMNSKE